MIDKLNDNKLTQGRLQQQSTSNKPDRCIRFLDRKLVCCRNTRGKYDTEKLKEAIDDQHKN